MNFNILIIFGIITVVRLLLDEETTNSNTQNVHKEPFSRNTLRNNGKMRRIHFPNYYLDEFKIENNHLEFYLHSLDLKTLNPRNIKKLYKVYTNEKDLTLEDDIANAAIVYLNDRVDYLCYYN